MSSEQGELKFFTSFPSRETLKLLLEWHALYTEMHAEQKRMSLITPESAMQLLGIPARKLQQFVSEGFLKEKPDGKLFKYQVLKLLFEMKQAELYDSIK